MCLLVYTSRTLKRVGKGGGDCCARFTGIKPDFSRIMQNSVFDFICHPYSIAELKCQLF